MRTYLRQIVLRGPSWGDGTPFWQLTASAPDMYRSTKNEPKLPDHVHPVRSLVIDAMHIPEVDGSFRKPHLMSVHLIAGQGIPDEMSPSTYGTQFGKAGPRREEAGLRTFPPGFGSHRPTGSGLNTPFPANESLRICVRSQTKNTHVEETVQSKRKWSFLGKPTVTPAYFTTGAAQDHKPSEAANTQFQHVVAQPLLGTSWPWSKAQPHGIPMPELALVSGEVHLAVAEGAFAWLGPLQLDFGGAPDTDLIRRHAVRLTPNGIEFETQVHFPGSPNRLHGWFLLAPDGDRLVLTLLPEKTKADHLKAWRTAWQRVIPAVDSEEALHGFRLSGNGDAVPSFRWELSTRALSETDKDRPGFRIGDTVNLPVEIPAEQLRLNLTSPRGADSTDGVVDVNGGHFVLAPVGAFTTSTLSQERYFGSEAHYQRFVKRFGTTEPLVLLWSDAHKVAATHLALEATAKAQSQPSFMEVSLVTPEHSPYKCSHDERRLAAALRDAYGLPPLPPGSADPKPSLLYGFVPMDDGWLQLPIPNLPPLDPSLDSDMVQLPTQQRRNSLNGFLRFGHANNAPPVMSAFPTGEDLFTLVDETPWMVTVEASSGLQLAVAIQPDDAGSTALFGVALVSEPQLSTRGLLWLSSDRPDALEAIPRLGAGAGAFLDVPLERHEAGLVEPVLSTDITALALRSTDKGPQAAQVLRTRLQLDLRMRLLSTQAAEDWRTIRWARHPHMPMAAQMPMTRSAKSAVRPLESRDLVPFVATPAEKPGESVRLSLLEWHDKECFPHLAGEWTYSSINSWPAPGKVIANGEGEDLNPEMKVRGVAFAAFGVPGVELCPTAITATGQWKLRVAMRYDLPVLDEAFATATLPPNGPGGVSSSSPAVEVEPVAATALDWSAMYSFWREQERCLQLARVSHSYLAEFGDEGAVRPTRVSSLVGGYLWETQLGFDAGTAAEILPYGWLTLADKRIQGNQALEGLSGRFKVDPSTKRLSVETDEATSATVDVLGYSPGSFLGDGYLRDARGGGAKPLEALIGNGGWWRPVASPLGQEPKPVGLLTCQQMIPVRSLAKSETALFHFWFKDLPILSGGSYKPKELRDKDKKKRKDAIDTHAWQDGHLLYSGFEWRLIPSDLPEEAFQSGRERMKFFGFFLEPLQLDETTFAPNAEKWPLTTRPLRADVLARLHLGNIPEDVEDGGNVVRLTLVPDGEEHLRLGDVTLIGVEEGKPKQPIRLPIRIGSRIVTLESKTPHWDGVAFTLWDASLIFEFLGQEVCLTGVKVSTEDAQVTATWESAIDTAPGTIGIRNAELKVGGEEKATFTFAHELAIAPRMGDEKTEGATVTIRSEERWLHGEEQGSPPSELTLLGSTAELRFDPGHKAVCFTATNGAALNGSLLEGFPKESILQFGLVAAIGPFSGPVAPLLAGSLSGTISGFKQATFVKLQSVRFHADCSRRGVSAPSTTAMNPWHGHLQLYGRVEGRSAIGWPAVDIESPAPIPFPDEAESGRTLVKLLPDEPWYVHDVEWTLEGHVLPFEMARAINAGEDGALWTVSAMSRHRIRACKNDVIDETDLLDFTGVDAIGMGTVAALIPPISAPDPKNPVTTFAARYRQNPPDTGKFEDGMLQPGRGNLGLVLQGFLGTNFRNALAKEKQTGVVFAGGFLGLLEGKFDRNEPTGSSPLLRLPAVLAMRDGPLHVAENKLPKLRQQSKSPLLELAWADGPSAATVATTFDAAETPVTPSERDLDAALLASARKLAKANAGWQKFADGLLVEQSFSIGTAENDDLSSTPYFLASAVGIRRCIKAEAARKQTRTSADHPRAISLLSRVERKVLLSGEVFQRTASALATVTDPGRNKRLKTQSAAGTPLPGELFVVGEDLVVLAWHTNFADDGSNVTASQISTLAYSVHPRPRLAMVRGTSGRYQCVALPQPLQKPRRRELVAQAFADAGRGYMLKVQDSGAMSGVEEGWTAAVRDDAASGIAAMSRVLNLPAHTASTTKKEDQKLVWLTQQRVPVYLPMATGFSAEPIPWLVPGAPRTRLPVRADINGALTRVADEAVWQPYVAEQAVVSSVSDRPGILMTRRLRLESNAQQASVDAFDADIPRFGRAGQASISMAVTERTPRPGKLPENTGDALRNRRPCVSPLLPKVNHRALVGPADCVRGVDNSDPNQAVGWSVTFVASPRSAGLVTESWDGTLELIAEIDERVMPGDANDNGDAAPTGFSEADGGAFWASELSSLLLGYSDCEAMKLKAQASLVIAGRALPFHSLHVLKAQGIKVDGGVHRGRVRLVLDMRETPSQTPGPAHAEIAELLTSSSVLPSVELHLTVVPGGRPGSADDIGNWVYQPIPETTTAYKLAKSSGSSLPTGEQRAPITLRMPLWPVLKARGALALVPTTMIFTDPAYDAGLSAPPYEEASRLNPSAALPPDRGELMLVFSADRRRLNSQGTVTLMVDLRFEKKLDPITQASLGKLIDGDLLPHVMENCPLLVRLQPRTGTGRTLFIRNDSSTTGGTAGASVRLQLAKVHELALTSLVEEDGRPASLLPGDILELQIQAPMIAAGNPLQLVLGRDAGNQPKTYAVDALASEDAPPPAVTLRLILTNEPVVEPPPGLYAALLRRKVPAPALSLPLYAQSPLPWRVDLLQAKDDMRAGLLRRTATFVWSVSRPHAETSQMGIHIVKSDRNGQTYLPTAEDEFLSPNRLPIE